MPRATSCVDGGRGKDGRSDVAMVREGSLLLKTDCKLEFPALSGAASSTHPWSTDVVLLREVASTQNKRASAEAEGERDLTSAQCECGVGDRGDRGPK